MNGRFIWIAVLFAGCATAAGGPGSLTGVVRQPTGEPLAGAHVYARVDGQLVGARVDSLGRFALPRLSGGRVPIEILCPTTIGRLAVPIARHDTTRVRAGAVTNIEYVIDSASSCRPLADRQRRVRWRGFYSGGFEESTFLPCPDNEAAVLVRTYGHPVGRRAWVTWDSSVYRAPNAGDTFMSRDQTRAFGFIELSGVVYGPGSYGHLGVSNFELHVDSVFSVRMQGACR